MSFETSIFVPTALYIGEKALEGFVSFCIGKYFSDSDPEIQDQVIKIFEDTENDFFSKYKEKYKDGKDSFIKNINNVKKMTGIVFSQDNDLTVDDFEPNNFDSTPCATEEEIKFLIDTYKKNLHENLEISNLLKIKKSLAESAVANSQISDIHEHFLSNNMNTTIISENTKNSINTNDLQLNSDKKNQLSNLNKWCLSKILEDQIMDADDPNDKSKVYAIGAWSKRNSEYVELLYELQNESYDGMKKESITMSSWIVDSLNLISHNTNQKNLEIENSLFLFQEYACSHFKNGFGLKQSLSRGWEVCSTPHHNIRGILALLNFNEHIPKLAGKIDKACKYAISLMVGKTIDDFEDEKPETFSSFIKLLNILPVTYFPEIKRNYLIKQTEAILNDDSFYKMNYHSWGVTAKTYKSESIDKALFVLTDIDMSLCKDNDLKTNLKKSLNNLIDNHLVKIDEESLGLPFTIGGIPDLGASIQLLWILLKNKNEINYDKKIIEKLFNFVLLAKDDEDYTKLAYPWFLSSIFHISLYLNQLDID